MRSYGNLFYLVYQGLAFENQDFDKQASPLENIGATLKQRKNAEKMRSRHVTKRLNVLALPLYKYTVQYIIRGFKL